MSLVPAICTEDIISLPNAIRVSLNNLDVDDVSLHMLFEMGMQLYILKDTIYCFFIAEVDDYTKSRWFRYNRNLDDDRIIVKEQISFSEVIDLVPHKIGDLVFYLDRFVGEM